MADLLPTSNPWTVAGLAAVALALIKLLDGVLRRVLRRFPTQAAGSSAVVENPTRDAMMREFGAINRRLDGIESEIKINRERYHDLAGVLSTVATEVKLLLAGRIKGV